jgi:protoporphyrinogen oxidase
MEACRMAGLWVGSLPMLSAQHWFIEVYLGRRAHRNHVKGIRSLHNEGSSRVMLRIAQVIGLDHLLGISFGRGRKRHI